VRLAQQITHRISGRLSAGRRSWLAAPLVLLLALLVTGGKYAALTPATAQTKTDDADQVSKGRALFLVGCASCHGKNGEGIITKRGNQYGPSLIGVGAAAVDFQVGTGRMPMAQPGTQALRKPPVYDAAEIESLGAFVASLGPGPAVPEKAEYSSEGATNEDIVRGGEFFRTNCTACHNSVGAGGALPGGKYAPKLDGVSAKHIAEAMITGPQQMPVFSDDVITPEDKSNIIAYIKAVQDQPNYGGMAGGGLGPVVDGLFTWIIGIGGLVIAAAWIGAHGARVKKK